MRLSPLISGLSGMGARFAEYLAMAFYCRIPVSEPGPAWIYSSCLCLLPVICRYLSGPIPGISLEKTLLYLSAVLLRFLYVSVF